MEVLKVPDGALNFAMAPWFWNLLEGETPPSFRYGPGNRNVANNWMQLVKLLKRKNSNLIYKTEICDLFLCLQKVKKSHSIIIVDIDEVLLQMVPVCLAQQKPIRMFTNSAFFRNRKEHFDLASHPIIMVLHTI